MFCPKCKSEFVEGISLCHDCHIPLVDELNDGIDLPEYQELYSVYLPPDASLLAIAKSLLEGEKIEYWVKNERLQELYGVGQLIGFNPLFGSAEIFVQEKDVEFCKDLLADLEVTDIVNE